LSPSLVVRPGPGLSGAVLAADPARAIVEKGPQPVDCRQLTAAAGGDPASRGQRRRPGLQRPALHAPPHPEARSLVPEGGIGACLHDDPFLLTLAQLGRVCEKTPPPRAFGPALPSSLAGFRGKGGTGGASV